MSSGPPPVPRIETPSWTPATDTLHQDPQTEALGMLAGLMLGLAPFLGPAGAPLAAAGAGILATLAKDTWKDAAKPSKKPTAAEVAEIDAHIKKGEYQEAIDKTIKYYGIDTSNVNGSVTYDASVTGADAETGADRKVAIGPSVFAYPDAGAPFTAATLLHEITHANQIAAHGWVKNMQDVAAYEAMGYQAALWQADQVGLTAARKQWYQDKVNDNRNSLTADNQKTYDSGQYWDMK